MDDEATTQAKATAWRECVAWFAYWPQMMFGPDYRVSQTVLDAIESANPYDPDPVQLQAGVDVEQVAEAMARARDLPGWNTRTSGTDSSQAFADRLLLARWISAMHRELELLSERAAQLD
jgi:hypothetical protein